jgi:hypothetical protein
MLVIFPQLMRLKLFLFFLKKNNNGEKKKEKVTAKKRKQKRQLEIFLLKKLYIICGEYDITNVHIINNACAEMTIRTAPIFFNFFKCF